MRVCLGLLSDGQAGRLREAGAHVYNHNLNTNEAHYANVCSTDTFADRIAVDVDDNGVEQVGVLRSGWGHMG
ncbi:MAG: hypothetical protein ACRDQ5_29005 [Sciscionella sp.]